MKLEIIGHTDGRLVMFKDCNSFRENVHSQNSRENVHTMSCLFNKASWVALDIALYNVSAVFFPLPNNSTLPLT